MFNKHQPWTQGPGDQDHTIFVVSKEFATNDSCRNKCSCNHIEIKRKNTQKETKQNKLKIEKKHKNKKIIKEKYTKTKT